MQNSLQTLDALERRLDVAVPVAHIEGEVQKRLAQLAKTVKVPGFRPGHVPLKMVAQQYGPQVRSDVISEAVQTSFNDAVRAQNLRIAGYPRIEPKQNASQDALEFSATFEIYPEVKLGDFSSLTIDRPQVELGEADVDRTLEVLRLQRAEWRTVDRAAKPGDRVLVDFTGTIAGIEFAGGQARDFTITLGEGRMLPEFEVALDGAKAGDEKSFALVFPEDYHGKEVAGKTAAFALTVKQVSEPVLPPLDEAFARSFGIGSGSVDDLRTEVRQNLALELRRKIESMLREQAMNGLRSRAEFVVPKSLVEMEAQGLLERTAAQLSKQGQKPEDMRLSPETFRQQAEERVVLGLVIGDLVRNHGLAAKPDQVKALVQEQASTYEQPEAVVRWHYEQPERLAEFESAAVERNIVEWVLGRAQVVDRPVSFQELMGTARTQA